VQISIEQISLNANRSFKSYEYDFLSRGQTLHTHNEFELATVYGARGVVYCAAESYLFCSGDAFLFGGRLPHRFIPHTGTNARALVLQFRKDAFGEDFFGLPENLHIRQLLEQSSAGLAFPSGLFDFPRRLSEIVQSGNSRRLPQLLFLLADLADIAGRGGGELLSPGRVNLKSRSVDEERLSRLQNFIEAGYTGEASLNAAADALALTRTSFCRYVKRITGRSYTDLLNDYRLTAAAMMLRDSTSAGLPVAELAGKAGFGSLSHFNSRFKSRFGSTPTEYRKSATAGEVSKNILD